MTSKQQYLRPDGLDVVTGRAVYGTDVYMDGMLYGKLVRSPVPHAIIKKIDVSDALKLDGVKAIITAQDIPDRKMKWLIDDQPLLARHKVRYIGEPIAAIAAETEEIAEEGANLIRVEYEELPHLMDIDKAISSDVLIHEEPNPYSVKADSSIKNVCSFSKIKRGNIEEGFKESDVIVEDTFETSIVNQLYMEPHAAVAKVENDGSITILTSTQAPYLIRAGVSWLLDIPINRIRVIGMRVGGGFGAKLAPIIEPYCVALAMKSGRPVKMCFTRFEELAYGIPQTGLKIWIKTGVRRDGSLVARHVKVFMDTGAYAGDSPVNVNIALLITLGAYKLEHAYGEGYAIYTNKPRCGAFRSVGAPQATFALESHMEHIADELGMDPLEFRFKNLWDDGYITPWGQRLENVGLRETFSKVAEIVRRWREGLKKNQGTGIACGVTVTAGMHPSSAIVRINEDFSAQIMVGTMEIGTGAAYGSIPLIVSQELGIPTEKITLTFNDTLYSPYSDGAQGSSTVYSAGKAVMIAARDAKQRLLRVAADMLEASVADLEMQDDRIYVKDNPGKFVSVSDVVYTSRYKYGREIEGYGSSVTHFPTYDKNSLEGFFYVPSLIDPTYTVHAAMVEVDEETGQVKILKYVAGQNSGKVIWYDGIVGQILGGVAQGIGVALYEELVVNENGTTINPTLMDYLVPTAMEVPNIDVVLVEEQRGSGPYGAKGAGEAPFVPPPATIATAIYRATGYLPHKLPIKPEEIYNGVKVRR